jgi:O-methyltransferase
MLRSVGYDVVPYATFRNQPNPARPWEHDQEFLALYDNIIGLTLLDRRRLHMLFQCAQNAARLLGDFAECGVYRGGSAWVLSRLKAADRTLYLFDTFAGMPATDLAKDIHQKHDFNDTTLDDVRSLLSAQPGVSFRAGFFPDTARGLEGTAFSLVHVDFDIYRSISDACVFFYPRLVRGGCIVFDDYGVPSCPGARQAIDEFCAAQRTHVLYLPTGQALLFNFWSTL